jgi:hypothetical protein
MPDHWIESLATQIRDKDRTAAEDFARAQHNSAVIAEKAKPFFVSLVQSLQDDINALRTALQGDLTASETGLQTLRSCEVKISRARFPWVDATLEHVGEAIKLEYVKAPGVAEDHATLEPKSCTFTFRVTEDDAVYIADMFSAEPANFYEPEELARRIAEMLFTP